MAGGLLGWTSHKLRSTTVPVLIFVVFVTLVLFLPRMVSMPLAGVTSVVLSSQQTSLRSSHDSRMHSRMRVDSRSKLGNQKTLFDRRGR
jgi:hypothetical protein